MRNDEAYLEHIRDVLIHHYMGVDLQAVWRVTQENLPLLKRTVCDILGDE